MWDHSGHLVLSLTHGSSYFYEAHREASCTAGNSRQSERGGTAHVQSDRLLAVKGDECSSDAASREAHCDAPNTGVKTCLCSAALSLSSVSGLVRSFTGRLEKWRELFHGKGTRCATRNAGEKKKKKNYRKPCVQIAGVNKGLNSPTSKRQLNMLNGSQKHLAKKREHHTVASVTVLKGSPSACAEEVV